MARWLGGIAMVLVLVTALVYAAGLGVFGREMHAGKPAARAIAKEIVGARADAVSSAAHEIGVAAPKQILFGDLHVHTTLSFDAFTASLPMAGGDGAHPVADACDYARHCSALDFWSITDHDLTLTPRTWNETIETIRQCNAVAEDPERPDTVAFLGWEWTQVGSTPENHWGHKNVILRDLEDGKIPTRPITADLGPRTETLAPSPLLLGLLALGEYSGGGSDFARFISATSGVPNCPPGVPVRDLPNDCRELAATPKELFAKLHEWNVASIVIPHGTTWGFYTPLGSSWDKQLTTEQNDPQQQRLIEVYSGHGNSEQFRPYREVALGADGKRTCPAPADNYLPSCWRAGEIIEARCRAEHRPDAECAERAATARQNFVDAERNAGFATVPGTTVADWQDAGQCRDCFQPAFNMRPRSSVQYIMSLEHEAEPNPLRFRLGFIASSDNHSARPGTGYKEVARTEFTEARFGNLLNTPIGAVKPRPALAQSEAYAPKPGDSPFAGFETERQASFFLTGGLAAVHATGRSRAAIWDALQRREAYATSGPRILLWFDLINAPGGQPLPMGGEVRLAEPPSFSVRAVGSFEQKPGCPPDALEALGAARAKRMCQGECYNPSDQRRPITRIEVVRIRPGADPDPAKRIEDPWQVIRCPGDASGCQGEFSDPEFATAGRDALYYVRAIEAPSPAVDGNPLGCTYDDSGRCTKINPCFGRPNEDQCLAEIEERAWSSPIFVDYAGS
ncbi:MAG TPA: DUF3604 domain-containing protein [Myxococcota bacterium]|nr:DUF3604 domain-containing protein [Myxococcota bacterium]